MTRNQLKYYSSLLLKKNRASEGKFIVEGKRLVEEALKSNFDIELVLYTNSFQEGNKSFLNSRLFNNTNSEVIAEKDFQKISDTKNPQGIAAILFIKNNTDANILENLVIAFENISDPGNLGTLLRTCDWFGINNTLISEGSADIYNPKVLRSSMGAIFHLDIVTGNIYRHLTELKSKGYKIFAADLKGENLFELSRSQKYAIVLCNEANGPTEKLTKIIDGKITVPKIGEAESLNVASAGAVIISQLTR